MGKGNLFCFKPVPFLVLLSLFPFVSIIHAGDEFQEKYRTHQNAVNAGKASLNKKDYQVGIDQYTKAIEMSPFVASHYYDRGIVL